jgi:hypothetical protein
LSPSWSTDAILAFVCSTMIAFRSLTFCTRNSLLLTASVV